MARITKAKAAETEIDLDALIEGVAPVAEVEAKFNAADTQLSNDPEFVAELLLIRFIHDVRAALDRLGWSQAELARRMNKKPQYVSRVLDAERRENLTIATMAEFACALSIDLEIRASAADQSGIEKSRSVSNNSDANPDNNDNFTPTAEIVYIDFEAAASEQGNYCSSNDIGVEESRMIAEPEVAYVYNFGS